MLISVHCRCLIYIHVTVRFYYLFITLFITVKPYLPFSTYSFKKTVFHNYNTPKMKLDGLHSKYFWSSLLQRFFFSCGISSLLHSVSLILFTLLLVHLILRISPHRSHHLRSHYLSLPWPFAADSELTYFSNPFLRGVLVLDLELIYWVSTGVCLSVHILLSTHPFVIFGD